MRTHIHRALALAGALALFGLAGTASATGHMSVGAPRPTTFSDPAGDASGAPDITSTTVRGDPSTGLMSVAVTIAGYQPPVVDGKVRWVNVWLDTDKNGGTGSTASGSEYTFQYYDDPADLEHWWDAGQWNGTSWASLSGDSPTLGFDRTGGVLTWSFAAADIGGARGFALYVNSGLDDASGNTLARDVAPDDTFKFDYDITGPTIMGMFAPAVIGAPTISPARPIAGKRMTISFPVSWSQGGKPLQLTGATMVCDPSVAGKVVTHQESFNGRVAKLTFVVPKTATGKQLKVHVTIMGGTLQGADGIVIHMGSGLIGVTTTVYNGMPTTRVAAFRVR